MVRTPPQHGTESAYTNLRCRCDTCCAGHRAYQAAWRKANPEKKRRHTAAWRATHSAEINAYNAAHAEHKAEYDRARMIEKGAEIRARVKVYNDSHKHEMYVAGLRRRYGLALAEVEGLLEAQGHQCAVCLCPLSMGSKPKPCVDHDHVTGKVRGVLCGPCNLGIGNLHESIGILRAAADYLERTQT